MSTCQCGDNKVYHFKNNGKILNLPSFIHMLTFQFLLTFLNFGILLPSLLFSSSSRSIPFGATNLLKATFKCS